MHGTEGKFQIEHSDKALNGGSPAEKITRDVQLVGRSEIAREGADFECLARMLRPKPADSRIGRRDLDARTPGLNLPGIDNPDLGGVLRLGGALRAPELCLNEGELDEERKHEDWDQPHPHKFQTALASLINLADDYSEKTTAEANRNSGIGAEVENDPDPLITPPLYGGWHALTRRLLVDINGYPVSPDDNWTHELNLDPRLRIPAGLGTQVVREKQEEYVNAALEQAAEMIETNRRIRAAQLAREVYWVWYERRLKPLRAANVERAFAITAPAQKRVPSRNSTVFHHLDASAATHAIVSPAMRRLIRPRGRLMRLLQFEGDVQPDNLIARAAGGELSSAQPKQSPSGMITVKELADTLGAKKAPQSLRDLLSRNSWLKYAPLALACLISPPLLLFGAAGLIAGGIIAAALVYAYKWLDRLAYELKRSGSISEENQTPESVDNLPHSQDFVIAEPDSGFTPTHEGSDSPDAARFKSALKDAYTLIEASANAAESPSRNHIEIAALTDDTIEALNPELTIPQRVLQVMTIPDELKAALTEEFKEAMVYPEIDQPMYEPLKDISPELFLPNISLIEQNSVTLLETNQRFIEAYLVGLNHEFARELLWRGYPTDQRGAPFRQFWDACGYLDSADSDGPAQEAFEEKLRDITPLHAWPKFSDLGDHNLRQEGGPKEEEVVLVIRGELLKKYPNTAVYAHRARWRRNSEPDHSSNGLTNGSIAPGIMIEGEQKRGLEELNGTEIGNPPRSKIKTPIYMATLGTDTFLFGFDLTAEQARGGAGVNSYDDPGWFFVLREQSDEPSDEPSFGLDGKKSDLNPRDWIDLSWERATPGAAAGAYIQINNPTPPFKTSPSPLPEEREKVEYREDGVSKNGNKDSSPADPPYILHQASSLMAIHAAEMLLKK
ncbi:MAG TPA: hypothetical protein VJ810_21205 [Blastocatellia bacterium]|nr:hypothetical protein [Blastocatellia bacterium]